MNSTNGKPVVAVGSIMHESNSFNAEPTSLAEWQFLEDFAQWSTGETEVTGFLAEAQRRGLDLRPTLHAAALPKGPVTEEAFEAITGRLLESLRAMPQLDGVLLALHGAMFTAKYPHADEEIVRRVRSVIGPSLPFVITHDFHANIPPGLVEMTDALVVYQQCPHLDTRQRGERAANILGRMLAGEIRPRQALVKPPLLWNIVYHNTYTGPLHPITQASMRLEAEPGILAASVACGYQYNDVEYIGPSVIVVAEGDRDRAQQEAQRLADSMWDNRESTRLHLPDPATAVRDAMRDERGPVSLFDVGDNIGGGSPGDETALLDELLKQHARGWVVILYDPQAVAAAKAAGIDGDFRMAVGGKSISSAGKPVPVEGRVRSLHDGRFIEPEVRHGGRRNFDMGHAAVIEVPGSTTEQPNLLILTSNRCFPFSLHQLRVGGVYPERQHILTVKGTVAPWAAYAPISARMQMVDTPGVTSVNPRRFEFKRIRPGIWDFEN